MHDGESAWARFRNGPGGDLLRQALTLRDESLASINLPRLPAEVILPGAIPWNLVAHEETRGRGEQMGRTLSVARTRRRAALTPPCWSCRPRAWRRP